MTMRIIYVTASPPWTPKFGGALRSNGILRGLIQSHEVHLALATTNPISSVWLERQNHGELGQLHILGSSEQIAFGGGSYAEAIQSKRGAFRKSFLELVEQVKPDVVWFHEKYTLRVVGFLRSVPTVVDLVDVSWRKLLREGNYQQGKGKIIAYTKAWASWIEDNWTCQQADVTVIANPEEKDLLACHKRIMAVPNGFDFPSHLSLSPRLQRRILFFGSLFYSPNLGGINWFCRDIWPHILRAVPGVQLDVIGNYEGELAFRQSEGVSIHGFVEDLDWFIGSSAFLAVPLLIGGGTRIKILEAWSKGLPVVSTTIGAEGLGAVHGKTILIGDTANEFAHACIWLLDQPNQAVGLAKEGFSYGKMRFDWRGIYPQLDQVLNTAVHISK